MRMFSFSTLFVTLYFHSSYGMGDLFAHEVHRKLGSISTGASISKLHFLEEPITWNTYNHGVLTIPQGLIYSSVKAAVVMP